MFVSLIIVMIGGLFIAVKDSWFLGDIMRMGINFQW